MSIPYKISRPLRGVPQLKYKCPNCGEPLQNAVTDGGIKDTCPQCQMELVVPGELAKKAYGERVNLAKEHRTKARSGRVVAGRVVVGFWRTTAEILTGMVSFLVKDVPKVAKTVWPILAIVSGCAALLLYNANNNLLASIVGFLLVGASLTAWVRQRSLQHGTILVAITWVSLVTLGVFWHTSGTFSEVWRNADGVFYTDTKRRSDGGIVYREVVSKLFRAEGSMTDTHKQHGRWEYVTYPELKREYEFYWYGDQITEGEWYLRVKD